jgi:hypothetical protein
MRAGIWLAVLAVVIGFSLTGAQAATSVLTYTGEVGPAVTGADGTFASVVIPRFDTSLGQLTGVSIAVSADLDPVVSFTNNAPGNEPFTWDWFHGELTVSAPTGSVLLDFLKEAGTENGRPYIASTTLGHSGSVTWTETYTDTTTAALTSDLGAFMGAGDVSFPVWAETSNEVSYGGGNATTNVYTNAHVSITVSYDYMPTPELGSFALMGLSMLPIAGAVVRRRRKR